MWPSVSAWALAVGVGVAVAVGVGEGVGVGVGLGAAAQYLPPVFKAVMPLSAPDDHFAAGPHCRVIGLGQRARWWCWWLSNCRCRDCISRRCSKAGRRMLRPRRSFRCRSTLPCDRYRAAGALVVLVAVQLSVLGLYLPPVFKVAADRLRPRRSFRCRSTLPCDSIGQRARRWCWWLSNCRCWDCICPPVFKSAAGTVPPQTIISLPVHTAV